jgi:hypothetical protein
MRPILLASLAALSLTHASADAAAPIAHPHGQRALVLRVFTGGGFVALSASLGAVPQFSLYGDGTVVVPATAPPSAREPAAVPLERFALSERQVQALLQRARHAGLLRRGAIDYGDMGSIGVSDGPTTTLTVVTGGRTTVRAAYALQFAAGTTRLSAAQAAARRALAAFVAHLPRGASRRYVPYGYAVYVQPFVGQPAGRGAVWPLASDLARAGHGSGAGFRCLTVTAGNARTLEIALRRTSAGSPWRMPGGSARYALIVRPLLPDQRSCR